MQPLKSIYSILFQHSAAMAGKSRVQLEKEDHQRDAEFGKALHGKSVEATGGFAAMLSKDKEAKKVAVDQYFKHFDNKTAEAETAEDREVGPGEPLHF